MSETWAVPSGDVAANDEPQVGNGVLFHSGFLLQGWEGMPFYCLFVACYSYSKLRFSFARMNYGIPSQSKKPTPALQRYGRIVPASNSISNSAKAFSPTTLHSRNVQIETSPCLDYQRLSSQQHRGSPERRRTPHEEPAAQVGAHPAFETESSEEESSEEDYGSYYSDALDDLRSDGQSETDEGERTKSALITTVCPIRISPSVHSASLRCLNPENGQCFLTESDEDDDDEVGFYHDFDDWERLARLQPGAHLLTEKVRIGCPLLSFCSTRISSEQWTLAERLNGERS